MQFSFLTGSSVLDDTKLPDVMSPRFQNDEVIAKKKVIDKSKISSAWKKRVKKADYSSDALIPRAGTNQKDLAE